MNFLNIKYKLLSLSIALIFLTIIISLMILSQSLNEKNNLELTKGYILESIAISKVVHAMQIERGHAMQIERGLSSGFLAKESLDKVDSKLLLAKKNLNKQVSLFSKDEMLS